MLNSKYCARCNLFLTASRLLAVLDVWALSQVAFIFFVYHRHRVWNPLTTGVRSSISVPYRPSGRLLLIRIVFPLNLFSLPRVAMS